MKRHNQPTTLEEAKALTEQVDMKEVDKVFFFVDHETNIPTEVSRGKPLSPYKPYAEVGGILKKPKQEADKSTKTP